MLFGRAAPRPANAVSRRLRANQARAREAIFRELDFDELQQISSFRVVETKALDKASHLGSPLLGAQLSDGSAGQLRAEGQDVQIVVSDGLSADAVHANVAHLLPVLVDGLESRAIRQGQPILARYGRVKLAERLAECLQCRLIILLIGERPGGDALAAQSLSAYLVYQLLDPDSQAKAAEFSGHPEIQFEYTVISNIYSGGLPPLEAGSLLAEKAWQILEQSAAGNRLESIALLKPPG